MRTAILRSLRHQNYRLFFCGQSVSLIGTWLTRTAISWLVYRLSHSATTLGVVNFASLAPSFLLTPFAGVLVDRWNRHRVLVATQVFSAIQSAALAILTLTGHVTIGGLVLLNAMQGLINAFDIPVRQSFVVQMIEDRKDLPNAIALNSSMVNLARLLGPSAAGVLIAAFGEGGCFTIDAVSYLAVIATLLMMRLPKPAEAMAKKKDFFTDFRDGFAYVGGHGAIRAILILFAVVSFLGVPYTTLLPMIVAERLHGNAQTLGYLTAASGLGALIGALILTTRESAEGLHRIIWLAALLFGVGLIVFGFARGFWPSCLAMLISGLGMMGHMAASNTALQSVVEESKRGRVMALFAMAYTGMAPFGSLFGGLLADRIGPDLTVASGGLVCVLGALLFARREALQTAAGPMATGSKGAR